MLMRLNWLQEHAPGATVIVLQAGDFAPPCEPLYSLVFLGSAERIPPEETCKLYSSPNGGTCYLIREPSGDVFVRHEANVASGGRVEHLGSRPSPEGLFLRDGPSTIRRHVHPVGTTGL
jgi:hypothetical protein